MWHESRDAGPGLASPPDDEARPRLVAAAGDLKGTHPKIRAFHAYFQRLREERCALPRFNAIDPVAIPALLPHVILVTLYDGEALRPRYRLTGTAIDRLAGANLSGVCFDRIYGPEALQRHLAHYESMIRDGRPRYWRHRLLLSNRDFIQVERLMLPFSEDGVRVDGIGGLVVEVSG